MDMLEKIKPLLTLIGQHESGGDYDAVWGGIRKADFPRKPLTKMTIGEVLAWQDSIDKKYSSEAAGKYQILEDTLRGCFADFGLKMSDLFDEAAQDKLALGLLRRRGLTRYLEGHISAEAFGQNISHEWASFPCMTRDKLGRVAVGQSYYAGDGLNKSGVKISDVLKVLRSISRQNYGPASVETPVAVPVKDTRANEPVKRSFGSMLISLLAALFRKS